MMRCRAPASGSGGTGETASARQASAPCGAVERGTSIPNILSPQISLPPRISKACRSQRCAGSQHATTAENVNRSSLSRDDGTGIQVARLTKLDLFQVNYSRLNLSYGLPPSGQELLSVTVDRF